MTGVLIAAKMRHRRRSFRALLATISTLGASPAAWAQAPDTSTAAASFQRREMMQTLRREIADEVRARVKEELREELKAELKQELGQTSALGGATEEESWSEQEWRWEEPVKPELNFLEFDGYFRFRYDFFENLDLDTYFYNTETGLETGPYSPNNVPPVPLCNTDPACAAARGAGSSLGGANVRLRVEPTFNVFEDIKIRMQVDVLDNLVLGSTPDGFPTNPDVPLLAFSQSQVPPSDGVNALADSVRFKRVWAEVMTPLGQLRVGRMPSHFGMGLLANEGRGIDSDHGDTNDRIMFATKIAGHYIVPAFDWTVSGPTNSLYGKPQGQPMDREQRDDVDQFILAIAKRDKDQEVREKLENDEAVVNYGVYGVYREQGLDAASYFKGSDPATQAVERDLIVRDATLWAYSAWFKLEYRHLVLELEQVGLFGEVKNSAASGTIGSAPSKSVSVEMWAAALKTEYKLLHDALVLRLLVLAASGDDAPGWGIQPLATSPSPGAWDGGQDNDGKIENFRVDPDFHVDLIFWRQLVGMVTDALVVRPGIQYNITDGLGGRLDVVYSRAWFAESTPSGGHDPDNHLGIEADAKIFYASDDGFHAWLEYGIFVPLGGLDRQVIAERSEVRVLEASIAQTIQVMLGVTY